MMHSYTIRGSYKSLTNSVLILVVMDDALVQLHCVHHALQQVVLILVVMDDALVPATNQVVYTLL